MSEWRIRLSGICGCAALRGLDPRHGMSHIQRILDTYCKEYWAHICKSDAVGTKLLLRLDCVYLIH